MTTLKAWMTGSPVSIRADASLGEALRAMGDHGIRHLPVVDGEGRLVGVLAFEDLRAALGHSVSRGTRPSPAAEREALEWSVGEVMSEPPMFAHAEDSLHDAADRMADARVGCLPIVNADGRPVGMFSEIDALRALAAAAWSDELRVGSATEKE